MSEEASDEEGKRTVNISLLPSGIVFLLYIVLFWEEPDIVDMLIKLLDSAAGG